MMKSYHITIDSRFRGNDNIGSHPGRGISGYLLLLCLFIIFSCGKKEFSEVDSESLFIKATDIITTDGSSEPGAPRYTPVVFLGENKLFFTREIIISIKERSGDFGVVDLSSMKKDTITTDGRNFSPVFSADRKEFYYARYDGGTVLGIYKMAAGEFRQEQVYVPVEGETPANYSPSPDGKKICLASASGAEADRKTDIFIYEVATGELKRLTDDGASTLPKWSPDGNYIVFSDVTLTKLYIYSIEENSKKEILALNYCALSGSGSPFTSDGRSFYFIGGTGDNPFSLNKFGIQDKRKFPMITARSGLMVKDYRLSDDDSKLAVVITEYEEEKNRQLDRIWIMNTAGTGLVKLTMKGEINNFPVWSPGGMKIAFVKDANLAVMTLYEEK